MESGALHRFAHHLLGAQQTGAIYPRQHPRVAGAIRDLYVFLRGMIGRDGRLRLARTESGFVIDSTPIRADGDLLRGLHRTLDRQGVERLTVDRGLQRWEVRALVEALNASPERLTETGGPQALLDSKGVRSIRLGRLTVDDGSSGPTLLSTSLGRVWDLYTQGMAATRRLRRDLDGGVAPESLAEANRVAANLVGAVGEHADAFVLLQALQRHDAYSYTHSLNVALLSLAMANAMRLPRTVLLDLAVAALLHDIGKELVPLDVLNKPGKLTEEEWEVMQRHSADGARLLMELPEVPELAVVVAYEHQLAYEPDNPDHGRWPLHLASQIVCLADVYDALRSRRPYRDALPPEKAMQIMESEADKKFDPFLFAGFRQMIGLYPPGTLVALDDGCLAVSLGQRGEEPDRPQVLVVRDPGGHELEPPLTLDLALALDPSPVRSLTPAEAGVDPFDYL